MRTRIWHSDWKPRWLIRCVSAALLSFMDKQEEFLSQGARERSANASDEAAERNRIISRCREEMGDYGSAMVKACADQDIEAYQALGRYPVELRSFVDRCEREMGRYGWSMVKACADQDIDAERALSDMMAE